MSPFVIRKQNAYIVPLFCFICLFAFEEICVATKTPLQTWSRNICIYGKVDDIKKEEVMFVACNYFPTFQDPLIYILLHPLFTVNFIEKFLYAASDCDTKLLKVRKSSITSFLDRYQCVFHG